MENKQMTSVEWLEKELYEWAGGRFYFPPHFFEEAKEMEKKQIIDAYKEGCFDNILDESTDKIRSEQYYNETYNK
jgi:hypothetical protein